MERGRWLSRVREADQAARRDAREAAASRTIEEGLEQAIAMWAVCVAELARRAKTPEQLSEWLSRDEPADLTQRWRERQ